MSSRRLRSVAGDSAGPLAKDAHRACVVLEGGPRAGLWYFVEDFEAFRESMRRLDLTAKDRDGWALAYEPTEPSRTEVHPLGMGYIGDVWTHSDHHVEAAADQWTDQRRRATP